MAIVVHAGAVLLCTSVCKHLVFEKLVSRHGKSARAAKFAGSSPIPSQAERGESPGMAIEAGEQRRLLATRGM